MLEHFIFLIHPCCYEGFTSEQLEQDNLHLYVEVENIVKARWLAALAEQSSTTLFVQLGGPEYLYEAARQQAGEAAACYLRTPFPQSKDLAEYYEQLAIDIRSHLSAHNWHFDPALVTAELWGESFEGCVPGYGGAFAQYLGLALAPRMRFEMTVYDSRFLFGAKPPEVIAVPDSDVEAWIFACHDGTGAAIFQSRNTAQWIDQRQVQLTLDDRRLQVCNKQGHTLWPAEPWTKGKDETLHTYRMPLSEAIWRWFRAVGMSYTDFKEVIRGARLETL